MLWIYFILGSIEIGILNVLMLRYVMIHGAVPRFRNINWAAYISFFFGPAIYWLGYNSPPQIDVSKFSFKNGGPCWKSCHQRSKREHHIVKVAGVINWLGLKSNLDATAAHAKMHWVHINESRKFLDSLTVLFLLLVGRIKTWHILRAICVLCFRKYRY